MELSQTRGTPSHHPFIDGFSIINHPFWGTPMTMETPMISQLRASVEPSKAPAAAELLTSSHSKAATCSRSNLSDPAACPSVNIKIVVKCPVDWCSSKIYGQKSWYCDDYKLGLSPPNIYRKKHEHLWYWYMYIYSRFSPPNDYIYIYTYIGNLKDILTGFDHF